MYLQSPKFLLFSLSLRNLSTFDFSYLCLYSISHSKSEDQFSRSTKATQDEAIDAAAGDDDDDDEQEDMHKGIADTENDRGNWTGRFDFLLSLLGYSVGLGNVWRFPYLCYNNGGGAFLIPFSIMLVIAGLPLMFMELSFGQYAALGPIAVYQRFCPLFKGLGVGMILVSAVVMLYYNVIIGWTIHYMFASFAAVLPWQTCAEPWSTESELWIYFEKLSQINVVFPFRLLFVCGGRSM